MAVSIPEARKARDMIVKEYKVTESVAWDFLCKLYDGGTGEKELREILDGNLACVPSQAKQYGIDIKSKNARKCKAYQDKQKALKENARQMASEIPDSVAGEVVEALPYGELPADITDRIENIITFFCNKYNIEDITKMSGEQWRACCMLIGQRLFKTTTILRNVEREKREGGKIYDPDRVSALMDIWVFLCGVGKHAPLAPDFVSFGGFSWDWLKGTNGRALLTSAGLNLYQKLRDLQEAGISSKLIEGKTNPTGSIFFLKNWHGWKDQREIVHTDTADAAPTMYPTFKPIENTPQITQNGDL